MPWLSGCGTFAYWVLTVCKWYSRSTRWNHLIIQVIEQADCEQLLIDLWIHCSCCIQASLDSAAFKDECAWHTNQTTDECCPCINSRTVQILHTSHDPALTTSALADAYTIVLIHWNWQYQHWLMAFIRVLKCGTLYRRNLIYVTHSFRNQSGISRTNGLTINELLLVEHWSCNRDCSTSRDCTVACISRKSEVLQPVDAVNRSIHANWSLSMSCLQVTCFVLRIVTVDERGNSRQKKFPMCKTPKTSSQDRQVLFDAILCTCTAESIVDTFYLSLKGW